MKNIIRISAVILLISLIHSCKKEDDNIIKDIDGNVYTSVTIGTQVWMVESLKTIKYRNGDLIGTTNPATLDISDEATPKYQWAYDGDESNVNTYGRLYTWYAATDTRNVCPTSWHIPSDDEWTTLTTYLGGVSIAGGKLKEFSTFHWLSPNEGAINSSGFTALPSGYNYDGSYRNLGFGGYWWSSTKYSNTASAYARSVIFDGANVYRYYYPKERGFSVRCLRD